MLAAWVGVGSEEEKGDGDDDGGGGASTNSAQVSLAFRPSVRSFATNAEPSYVDVE